MITISDVSHTFVEKRGTASYAVLKSISIHIKKGEFVTIFGPSGAGKSTLVNLIGGYAKLQSGSILINGESCNMPGKNRVVVNQENDLFDWLTVEENLRLITNDETLISKYIAIVQMQNYRNYYPCALSGGMKKRVSLIRALLVHPKILVLDEPFASLDAHMKEELHLELDRIFTLTGTTTILVTHDLEEAVFLSDRIVLLGNHPAQIVGEVAINYKHPRRITLKHSRIFKDIKQKVRGITHQIGEK